MKTAEEILDDIDSEYCTNSDCSGSSTHYEYDEVLKAMKVYANQKLDEATELMPEFNFVNKKLILSLKDKT